MSEPSKAISIDAARQAQIAGIIQPCTSRLLNHIIPAERILLLEQGVTKSDPTTGVATLRPHQERYLVELRRFGERQIGELQLLLEEPGDPDNDIKGNPASQRFREIRLHQAMFEQDQYIVPFVQDLETQIEQLELQKARAGTPEAEQSQLQVEIEALEAVKLEVIMVHPKDFNMEIAESPQAKQAWKDLVEMIDED